jgi:chromosome segregation ATPase
MENEINALEKLINKHEGLVVAYDEKIAELKPKKKQCESTVKEKFGCDISEIDEAISEREEKLAEIIQSIKDTIAEVEGNAD